MTPTADPTAECDLVRVVGELAQDPLYQLSTAGQELFHTNMLFWLASHEPYASTPVWDRLGVDAPTLGGPDPRGAIRREWRHIDLYIDSGMPGRKLVLENKVLAIATAEQLVGYRGSLLKAREHRAVDPTGQLTSWRLLTLLEPTFEMPEPWQTLRYQDLVAPIEQTALDLRDDSAVLVRGYGQLVKRLVRLASAADVSLSLDAPARVAPDLIPALNEGRLYSLVSKVHAVGLSNILNRKLDARGTTSRRVGAGLTRGEMLVEFFTPGTRGRQFGWQIQNGQVRLAMITGRQDPKSVAGRDRVAKDNADYFDFDLPDELQRFVEPYSGQREWLGYGTDFVYRYVKLRPHASWSNLVDLGASLTKRALEYTR
jgi:hypothetical protein